MKLIKIEKKFEGNFLSYYISTYINKNNKEKKYEMISRNENFTVDNIQDTKSSAVAIIAFDETREHILLNKEFRLTMNREIYSFPCGLIDAGENAIIAGKRELKEETGLDLLEVISHLGPAYSAMEFTNEVLETIICTAGGTFSPSTSYDEEIEAGWFSKAEIKELLKTEYCSARTQLFLYTWINGK